MGVKFGNLWKVRGLVFFRLSPYEQRPLVGTFSEGPLYAMARMRQRFNQFGPVAIGLYLLITWGNEYNELSKRKNPEDYANDV